MSRRHEALTTDESRRPSSRARVRTWALGGLLLAGLAAAAMSTTDTAALLAALAKIGAWATGMGLLLSMVNYALRHVRWQLYLGVQGQRVSWRDSLLVYIAGFAFTATPAKAGEAVRCWWLARRGVAPAATLAALVSERLSDVCVMLAFAACGLALRPDLVPLAAVGLLLAVAALALLWRAAPARAPQTESTPRESPDQDSLLQRARRLLRQTYEQARACNRPATWTAAFGLGLVAWGAEIWAFDLILSAAGHRLTATATAMIYAVAILAGALSFVPAGLGGTEAAMVSLLLWQQVPMPQAIAVTLVTRVVTLWFAVGLGVVALMILRTGETTPRNELR